MQATWQRVRAANNRLSARAVQQMESLGWFATLSASQRADVGLVVQLGLTSFTDWLADPVQSPAPTPAVFNAAPRELARTISLKQTVQLIRTVVSVLEEQVPSLAAPGHEQELREAVLRYSREVAFGAAEVYAATAEARGAWDARVEAGVVDSLVRGQTGDITVARATSLGWGRPAWVTALAARAPSEPLDLALAVLHTLARHAGLSLLVGEAGGGLIVVVGGHGLAETAIIRLAACLPDGPVVVGPYVEDLPGATGSVQEALAGLASVAAWQGAPRPVDAAALLAERAVLGDETARRRLLSEVYEPLAAAGIELVRTAGAYLDCGGSLEGTGRALFLHPNSVRYRLRKIIDATGYDLTVPREAQVVRLALVLGRTSTL